MRDDEPEWKCFLVYPDEASAIAVAGYLNSRGCPARVAAGSPTLDMSPSAQVLVHGHLLHRARFLWAQADLTDGELEYLITGKLPDADP